MSLLPLANELLVAIAQRLDSEKDINALARTNRRLYQLLIAHLYRHNARWSGSSALYWAARVGRGETLQRAVTVGAKLHEHGLLSLAAEYGQEGIVHLLLAVDGIDLNVKHGSQWTPLAVASRKGHLGVARMLVKAGADLRVGYDGWTPLNVAANSGHVEIVRFLCDSGSSVGEPSDTGWTPLKSAACNGHREVVELLLGRGANVHAAAERDWTPLHSAASFGHAAIVGLLVDHGAKMGVATLDGWTPLTLAADKGRVEAVKMLIKMGADISQACGNGWTPLTLASDSGHVDVVQLLLSSGANVKSTCNNGWTSLSLASGASHLAVAKLLLNHGADVAATNDAGWSALLIASDRGHHDLVALLLERGADVTTANRNGWTALHAAAENGDDDVAKLLLAAGADPMAGNRSGWSPLHVAAHNNHFLIVDLILRMPGLDVSHKDNNGRTAMFHAAMRGNVDVVEQFLSRSIALDVPDAYGTTALTAAVRNGHDAVVRQLLGYDTPRSPIHPALEDGLGRSIVWWAERSGSTDMPALVREYVQAAPGSPLGGEIFDFQPGPVFFVEDSCWCEVCTRCTVLGTTSFECPICDGGCFLICAECHESGFRCRSDAHQLVPHQCNRVE
ncbi:hypothetical protein CDD83_5940 [Cordyceps sp. RAO-2017]|nr:hypothetical protein CDD83_5940 [Cordyceps sp. RAO-2017]